MKVSVIGAGSWGMALAKVLDDNGHDVLVYDVDENVIEKINTLHICHQLDEYVPETIRATGDMIRVVRHSDALLFAVPTKVLRAAIEAVLAHIEAPKLFINAAKGLEPATFKRMSEVFEEMIPDAKRKGFVALSGPSHAEEVIRGLPTLITCASEDEAHAIAAQRLFHNKDYFRVYSSTDLIGVELGGALKNIFAIAAGILRGQDYGDNAMAALLTRGLVEMGKIYDHLGASKESLFGLTGIGDLFVTCISPHSRNFQAGYKIGKGKDLHATLSSMTMVVEGIRTCEAVHQFTRDNDLDTPIIDALYDVVFNRLDPAVACEKLLSRDEKRE